VSDKILVNPYTYLGEKTGHFLNWKVKLFNFLGNLVKNGRSFWFKGDPVFRQNIPLKPTLDLILGLFFLLGIVLFLGEIKRKKDKRKVVLLISFFLIQLSSLLDVANPRNSPSTGRMLGTAPIVFYITAGGIYYFFCQVKKRIKINVISGLIFISFFLGFFWINFYQYFFIYPKFLPNKNTPFGKIIARKIDQYPLETKIVIVGCCWGDWGQPEQGAIIDRLRAKHIINFVDDSELSGLNSSLLVENNMVYIVSPRRSDIVSQIKSASPALKIEKIDQNGYTVALVVKNIFSNR